MTSHESIREIINRILQGTATPDDLANLAQLYRAGQLTIATGQGAVAVGGDVANSLVITGSDNLVITGVDAHIVQQAVRQALEEFTQPSRSKANSDTQSGDPRLKNDLVNTLTQAFPTRGDIAQLVSFYLGTSIEAIPREGNHLGALFLGIVEWCEQQQGDMLKRLIDGAIEMRPLRSDLKALRLRMQRAGWSIG